MNPGTKWPLVNANQQDAIHEQFSQMYSVRSSLWAVLFDQDYYIVKLSGIIPLQAYWVSVRREWNGDKMAVLIEINDRVRGHGDEEVEATESRYDGFQYRLGVNRKKLYDGDISSDDAFYLNEPTIEGYNPEWDDNDYTWIPQDPMEYTRQVQQHMVGLFDGMYVIRGDTRSVGVFGTHAVTISSGEIGLVPNNDGVAPQSQMYTLLRNMNEYDAQSMNNLRMRREARVQEYAHRIYFDICHGSATNKYTKQELLQFADAIGIDTMNFVKQNGKDTLVNKDTICKIVKDVLDANIDSTGVSKMSNSRII